MKIQGLKSKSVPVEVSVKPLKRPDQTSKTDVSDVSKRYEVAASTISDRRRIERMGKLVLSNLDDMDFVPVQIEAAKPPAVVPMPTTHSRICGGGAPLTFTLDTPF
jgi:hypothetical protein